MNDEDKYVATNKPPENFNSDLDYVDNNNNNNKTGFTKFNKSMDGAEISGEIKVNIEVSQPDVFVPESISASSLKNNFKRNNDFYTEANNEAQSISRLQDNAIKSMDRTNDYEAFDYNNNTFENHNHNHNNYSNEETNDNTVTNNEFDESSQNINNRDEKSDNHLENDNLQDEKNLDNQDNLSNGANEDYAANGNDKNDNMFKRRNDLKKEKERLNDPENRDKLKQNKQDAKQAKQDAKDAKKEAKTNKKDNPDAYKDKKNDYKDAKNKYKDAKRDVRKNNIDRLRNTANRVQNAKDMLDDPGQAAKDWAKTKFDPREMARNYANKQLNKAKQKAANTAKNAGKKASNFLKDKAKKATDKFKGTIKNLLKKHPEVLFSLFIILFVFFIVILIAMAVTTDVAAGSEDELSSETYTSTSFEDTTFNLTDHEGNVIESNVALNDLLKAMAYMDLGESATEAQYEAYFAIAKPYLLIEAGYSSSNIELTVESTDSTSKSGVSVKNCDTSGCDIYTDNSIHIYFQKGYTLLDSQSSLTLSETKPAISADAKTKMDNSLSETYLKIAAPTKITVFSVLTYSLPAASSISAQILESTATDANTIISEILGDDYSIVDTSDYFSSFGTLGCDTGDWWWPSGSKECTTENGVTICAGEPEISVVSCSFGYYSNGDRHWGIDISNGNSYGTNVIASRSGTVVQAPNNSDYNYGWGNYVKIKHSDGTYSLYAHNSAVFVKVGDTVVQGQKIAEVGQTGNADGAHIHFEIWLSSDKNTRVDPASYISSTNPRKGECSSDVSDSDINSASDNRQKLCLMFRQKGLSDNAVATLLTNINFESSYNPSTVNTSSGATGICQWLGGRLTNLKSQCGSKYKTLECQKNFIFYEFENGYSNSRKILSNTNLSVSEMTYNFCMKYEAPGESYCANRRTGTQYKISPEEQLKYVKNGCK